MAKFNFRRGLHIVLHGRERFIELKCADGQWQMRDVANGTLSTALESELVDAFFAGHLQLIGEERASKYVQRKIAKDLSLDFTELSKELSDEAKRRLAYVRCIPAEHRNTAKKEILGPIISGVSKQIGDSHPPSYSTLYRWNRDFLASGEDIRALVPSTRNRGNKSDKVPQPGVSEIIEDLITTKYLTTERLSVYAVYEAIVIQIDNNNRFLSDKEKLHLPSPSTVYKRVQKRDPYDVAKARYGTRYADQKFMGTKAGPRAERPLERVEIDHTKIDLFVVDDASRMPIGRPWFTAMIDYYTKAIVGFYLSFNPPSYLSVMNCLRHAVMPKTYVRTRYPDIQNNWDMYGIPEVLVTDNGKEFLSTHLENAALQIGTRLQFTPVLRPWYKGTIERFFRSLNQQFLHRQPGTSFSNIFDKKDYDPVKNAVIGFNSLLELIHTWIVDVYLQKEHRGLKDVPARVWAVGTADFKPELPSRPDDLKALLGEITMRTLTKSGIEWEGLIYQDDSLALLRRRLNGQPATVKLDPNDIGILHVFDPFTSSYVTVPAVDMSYAKGLSKWQHQVIRALARRSVKGAIDIVALCRAKAMIQGIVEKEYNATKKTGSRQKMARWLGTSSGQIHDAPLLGHESVPLLADAEVFYDTEPGSTDVENAIWSGIADFAQSDGRTLVEVTESPDIKSKHVQAPDEAASEGGRIVSAEEITEKKSRKSKTSENAKRPIQIKKRIENDPINVDPRPQQMPSGLTEGDSLHLDTSGWGGSYIDIDQED